MDLRHSGITNSAGSPSTENKERIKKVKETEDSRYIYQNELDKACFQHDMAYTGFKDLTRRTAAGKYYVMKHLILLKVKSMMNINADLLRWSINILIKKFRWNSYKRKYFK